MIEHNGKMYARVSEIIKPFVDFSHIDPEVLNRKAALGTRVHAAIHEEIEGGMPVLPRQEAGYFQSWIQWRDITCPYFEKSEVRIFNEEKRITGCVDALVGWDRSVTLTLCDWKTAVCESPTWVMQAHLYWFLLKGDKYPVHDRFVFLRLDKSGGLPKVHQYVLDLRILQKCMKAIDDFWHKNEQNVYINPL